MDYWDPDFIETWIHKFHLEQMQIYAMNLINFLEQNWV